MGTCQVLRQQPVAQRGCRTGSRRASALLRRAPMAGISSWRRSLLGSAAVSRACAPWADLLLRRHAQPGLLAGRPSPRPMAGAAPGAAPLRRARRRTRAALTRQWRKLLRRCAVGAGCCGCSIASLKACRIWHPAQRRAKVRAHIQAESCASAWTPRAGPMVTLSQLQ